MVKSLFSRSAYTYGLTPSSNAYLCLSIISFELCLCGFLITWLSYFCLTKTNGFSKWSEFWFRSSFISMQLTKTLLLSMTLVGCSLVSLGPKKNYATITCGQFSWMFFQERVFILLGFSVLQLILEWVVYPRIFPNIGLTKEEQEQLDFWESSPNSLKTSAINPVRFSQQKKSVVDSWNGHSLMFGQTLAKKRRHRI